MSRRGLSLWVGALRKQWAVAEQEGRRAELDEREHLPLAAAAPKTLKRRDVRHTLSSHYILKEVLRFDPLVSKILS